MRASDNPDSSTTLTTIGIALVAATFVAGWFFMRPQRVTPLPASPNLVPTETAAELPVPPDSQRSAPASPLAALEALAVTALRDAKTTEDILDRACALCHGAQGEGSDDLQTPSIAGLPLWYLRSQLERFRTGKRGDHPDDEHGRRMAAVARALPKASVAALAKTISAMTPFATRATIDGDIENGRLVYDEQCIECHRYNGQGEQVFRSSPLTTLQDWYLLREFEEFRKGWRGNDPKDVQGEKMRDVTRILDAKSRRDVIAFIARLAEEFPPGK